LFRAGCGTNAAADAYSAFGGSRAGYAGCDCRGRRKPVPAPLSGARRLGAAGFFAAGFDLPAAAGLRLIFRTGWVGSLAAAGVGRFFPAFVADAGAVFRESPRGVWTWTAAADKNSTAGFQTNVGRAGTVIKFYSKNA